MYNDSQNLKVLHTISGLNLSSGGPSVSSWSLITGLRDNGIDADILTYLPRNPAEQMIGNGSFLRTLPSPRETRYGYSVKVLKFLQKNEYDLYHGHGLWQFPVHAMAKYARKQKKPCIITPRGMLYPAGLQSSALLKKVALSLYQRKDLEAATVLHATCRQEMEHLRKLNFINPIAIIPNAIDIKVPPKIEGLKKEKKQVGFLGRFAPIKNLEMLIDAWAETAKDNPEWELVLIGDGDSKYKKQLIQQVKALKIRNIRFTGFLSGTKKEEALQSLDYLVLPSKSENFGMVVSEALIREIPVIASKGTPWEEIHTINAGWWIDIGEKPLKSALNVALQTNKSERVKMGINGKKMVMENYSIESVAKKIIRLYEWILKKGKSPGFMY